MIGIKFLHSKSHFEKLMSTISFAFNKNLFSLYIAGFALGLRLSEVRIPNHTVRHNQARLECYYDLDGEALYSVKWYKDGNEFYRYVPRDMPPAQFFSLPGVSVDVSIDIFLFNYDK